MRVTLRQLQIFGAALFLFVTLGLVALPGAGHAAGTVEETRQTVFCPFSAAELSTIMGRRVQRVALGGGKPGDQCAFSAVDHGTVVNPQIYLTLGPGNASDLRNGYRYYVGARAQLATRPQVKARPDLGPGAFTLTSADGDVTTAFFVSGGNVASVSLDLSGAPRQDKAIMAQILALAVKRSPQ